MTSMRFPTVAGTTSTVTSSGEPPILISPSETPLGEDAISTPPTGLPSLPATACAVTRPAWLTTTTSPPSASFSSRVTAWADDTHERTAITAVEIAILCKKSCII